MVKIERIAIFGATGMTGICVLQEALDSGFQIIKVLLRDPSKLPPKYAEKVEIIKGDVTNTEDVNNTVADVDAVIVVIGTRNNLDPTTELSRGLENIVNAMKRGNLKVISVCLSAFLFYDPEKVPPVFKHINEEHKRMLDILKSSDLHYIAIFPPHIADNPKSEYTVKHDSSPGGRVVSKYELASFLVTALFKEEHYGHIVGICSTSSLPKSQCFFKLGSDKSSRMKPRKNLLEGLTPLKGYDDPNFWEYYKKVAFDWEAQKIGFKNLLSHIGRFYKEKIQDMRTARNPRIDGVQNRVDVLYKFETPEDIQKFTVYTDSGFNLGYSSASFNLTENETATFSGNIDTTIPKSGTIAFAGYCCLSGPNQNRAFFLTKPYNWKNYTHLVFKVRGDGRTYVVILHTKQAYEEIKYTQFHHLLHTRGGPYWQIVKIPFSYFYCTINGRILINQRWHVCRDNILRISLTTGGYEGPFKLEIDYIGLERKLNYKKESPFEVYKLVL